MKKSKTLITGLILTALIFIASFLGKDILTNADVFPKTFGFHTIMLILSIIAIVLFKNKVNYTIKLPKYDTLLNPVAVGLLVSILVNLIVNVMNNKMGIKPESLNNVLNLNPTQAFIFIFIYASIAEELLFRGFLLNYLSPFKTHLVPFFKRTLSLSIIISAFAFGIAQFILFSVITEYSLAFKVAVFSFVLGIFTGYYQEKYNNNIYAILVHMAAYFTTYISVLYLH